MNRMLISMGLVAAIGLLIAMAGCGDTCGDVDCGPAPPLLQVAVMDTMTDSVRLAVNRTDPVRIDTIDTVMVMQVRVTDALVTLLRVDGQDTVAFDTLAATGDLYTRDDPTGLPATPFYVAATRKGRAARQGNLTLRHVDGCCPYSVVGFYTLRLPSL